ncbi:MAG: PQQ-binding-like beta-propeller repeat protein [Terriglobales bacterium]
MFTAQVTGTGSFSTGVTWSVQGVNGGNTTVGTIVAGQYTAPAVAPTPSNFTITATSAQDTTKSGNSTVTVYAPASLISIVPNAASAGEQITINGQNLYGPTTAAFVGTSGTSISEPIEPSNSPTQITVVVPFGAATGPVSVNLTPFQGFNETTNAIAFTRLPNLLVHAPTKDLSSGETLQLDWRLLGANSPSVMNWTADSGNVNAQGVFQAPVVSGESYSRVTGCIETTTSCDTVLLRILPFRITPTDPIVNVGNTLQLDALQGTSLLSPQWSVLAGGGSITSGGLFTAPTVAAQAGPVPVAATAGTTTEQTSVAVSGAFPGLVNRVFDYADFTTFTPPEATFVKSVAVSGNRAYTLTGGTPFQLTPSYEALDVYDISNPDQPVWIDAGEAANNYPADLFAYGNTLFSLDSNDLVVYSLMTQVPTLTAIVPIAQPWAWTLNNGVLYVLPYIPPEVQTSYAIDLYDMTTGTAVHNHYDIPYPSTDIGELVGISGTGNILYLSGFLIVNNTQTFTIATYDLSQSPPSLLSTVVTTSGTEFHLQVVGNLLFADSQVYDISNITPAQIATIPIQIGAVWGVEGNNVLASGGFLVSAVNPPTGGSANYAVVNISSPSDPVVQANVVDLTTWDIFNPSTATWANNGRFYAADGTGGIAVYNASSSGGPATATVAPIFVYIYDQVIAQQTLYAAALYGSGAGGLACFDVSGATPSLLGTLMYPNDSSYALQVSGTTVFLGLADSLKVVNASNPQSPVEIGSVAIPVNALALSGNTLFVGTGDGRLVVFDVSTPASPKQIASVTTAVTSTMRLSGNLLLVAAGASGLLVFDVSQPSTPVMLSQFLPSVGSPVWDVMSLGGSAVMLAADSSGIVTVDISNPSNPQQLYQQQLPFLNAFPAHATSAGIVPAFALASQNGLTYVGTTAGIMFAFDATVPAIPRLVTLNVVGVQDTDIVSVITPGTSNLYLAVQGVTIQLNNTVPQNSIELYYPPAALSIAYPIGDGAKRNGRAGNPKLEWMSRRSATNAAHAPDRFGVVQHGSGERSAKQ